MKRLIIGSVLIFLILGFWAYIAYQFWYYPLVYSLPIVPYLSDAEKQAVSDVSWFSGIVVIISILLIATGNRGKKRKKQI